MDKGNTSKRQEDHSTLFATKQRDQFTVEHLKVIRLVDFTSEKKPIEASASGIEEVYLSFPELFQARENFHYR